MTEPKCTCDEGRTSVCHQMGTEPHYVGCPRWGSPITGGYVGHGVRPALPDNTHWYDQGGVIPPGLTRVRNDSGEDKEDKEVRPS